MSNDFAATLASGRFVLTAELECPRHAGPANVERQARAQLARVDAVTCTDNSAATVRMSPIAAAAIVARMGGTALVHLGCRDRNRLALQSDILGAAAVGAAGVICVRGDPPAVGGHAEAAAVYDLDTLDLIRAARTLTDGRFPSGEPIRTPPRLVVGSVVRPRDSERAVADLRAKVEAGAELLISQIGYDTDLIDRWMARVRAAGLHERARILVGVAPIRRLAIATYLRDDVPGVSVPDAVLARLEAAGDVEAEGVCIAAERLRALRLIEGVAGAHLMTFGWVEGVARVLDAEARLAGE